jgi:putative transposase
MDAAKRFFTQAVAVVGHAPEWVTTDGHDSYLRAIHQTLGKEVTHRCNPYLNNRLEQDHCGIKQRDSPVRGFGNLAWAARFCRRAGDFGYPFQNQEGNGHAGNFHTTYLMRRLPRKRTGRAS